MFRPATALRFVPSSNAFVARATIRKSFLKAQLTTSTRYGLAIRKPASTALTRYLSTTPTLRDSVYANLAEEKAVAERGKQLMRPDPRTVSTESSIHNITGETGVTEEEPDVDMMAGAKNDFATIKDTFSLKEVPREALYVGIAGVVPYAATSLSTAFLAWDVNYAHATGAGLFFSDTTAELLLHLLEPIQVGYGAVILSFLGAIHWGLEWAGYGGYQGYRRYAFGVLAPALAWPTLLMPIEYALITQFFTFTFLYYNDARSVVRGWSPPWYAVYRFVLTAFVGASIVLTLIGRGQIADKISRQPGPADKMRELRSRQLDEIEEEEAKRLARGGSATEELEEEE